MAKWSPLQVIARHLIDTRWYTNMIVLLSAVNEATFEVLYNVLTVTKTQVVLYFTTILVFLVTS